MTYAFRSRIVAALLLGAPLLSAADYPEGREALRRGALEVAAREFAEGARSGESRAQYAIGLLSATGAGVPQSDQEAAGWFAKAAVQGHAPAQYNIGVMYQYGRGVAKDGNEAVHWYRLAADSGLAQAQSDLGFLSFIGEGVKRDYPEALLWLERAAAQGHPIAQSNLACAYLAGGATRYLGGEGGPIMFGPVVSGSFLPPDEKRAAHWLRAAAESGHVVAQFNLALLLDQGRGVARNASEAVRWYEKAAAADFVPAFINLALLYERGAAPPPAAGASQQLRMKSSGRGVHRAQEYPVLLLQFGANSLLDNRDVRVRGVPAQSKDILFHAHPGLLVDPELGMPGFAPAQARGIK